MSQVVIVDPGESVNYINTEQDKSDRPVLLGRRRRKRLLPALTSESAESRAETPIPRTKRYRQGRKAQQTISSTKSVVSYRVNNAVLSTATPINNDIPLTLSIRQPKSKRRGRKPKWMVPFNLEAIVHKQSQNRPAWAVDRIVGSVYENGKLYYKVR